MSKKEKIHSDSAPAAIGPYSQAIKAGNTVFFSGQIPLNPATMQLVSGNIREQARQVFANLQAVAESAGAQLEDVVKLTVYLTDLNSFAEFNEVMKGFFSEPFPARTTIQVSGLPRGAQVEVDAVIIIPA